MSGLIVHEWFEKTGGAEKVVDEFVKEFPDAHLRVLWNDAAPLPASSVSESWLASTPFRRSKIAALPLMPITWRHMKVEQDYSWMLVSSHLFAHHAKTRNRDIPKIVYAHTPARYIWVPELDRRGANVLVKSAAKVLKPIDRHYAREAQEIIANSKYTASRIEQTWGREARVIHPPADVARLQSQEDWAAVVDESEAALLETLPREYVLGASRFVPYKRLDLVIDAAEAVDTPAVLVGSGPDLPRLRERASRATIPVYFIPAPSDELLFALYQRASVFVFPAIEDFGIMPVESMALGTPVVVASTGGALESVNKINGGASIEVFEPREWRRVVEDVLTLNRTEMRSRAACFSREVFRQSIRDIVKDYE